MKPSCNDCRKCGENTCGNDMEYLSCFEPRETYKLCKHSFIDKDNEGVYGKEVCRFCGYIRNKDKSYDK